MDKAEMEKKLQQLSINATAQIGEIVIDGSEKRKQIGFLKDSFTSALIENDKVKKYAEEKEVINREQLLKLLGEAAAAGDFDEMNHIRSLLKKP